MNITNCYSQTDTEIFQSHTDRDSHWRSVSVTPVALIPVCVCVCVGGSQLATSSPNIIPLSIYTSASSFRSHDDACVITPGALWAVTMVTAAGSHPIRRRDGENLCLFVSGKHASRDVFPADAEGINLAPDFVDCACELLMKDIFLFRCINDVKKQG